MNIEANACDDCENLSEINTRKYFTSLMFSMMNTNNFADDNTKQNKDRNFVAEDLLGILSAKTMQE